MDSSQRINATNAGVNTENVVDDVGRGGGYSINTTTTAGASAPTTTTMNTNVVVPPPYNLMYGMTNPTIALQSLLQTNPALAEMMMGKLQQHQQKPSPNQQLTSPHLLELVSTLLNGQRGVSMTNGTVGFRQQQQHQTSNPGVAYGVGSPNVTAATTPSLTSAAPAHAPEGFSQQQQSQPQMIQNGSLHATLLQMGMLQRMQQQQRHVHHQHQLQQQQPLQQDSHQPQQQQQMEQVTKNEQLKDSFEKGERTSRSQFQKQDFIPVANKQQPMEDQKGTLNGTISVGLHSVNEMRSSENVDDAKDMQRPTRLPCRARGMDLDHNFEVRSIQHLI
jgi:hypothetical protein